MLNSDAHNSPRPETPQAVVVKRAGARRAVVMLLDMADVIEDMAPWASAGLDDPNVCDELKDIYRRIVELDAINREDDED